MPAARSSFLGENLNVDSAVSATSLISVTGDDDDRTPYERVLYGLHHDQRWLKEITLGRRVGFYRFRGELGQGNFSTVRLALHQLTRDKVAVKVIDKAKLDQKTQRMLAREIANMDAVAHPNIIRLFEVVETLSRIHLVLEFAPGGELFNRITADGRLTEHDSAKVFTQVLAAITYLHGLSIIHRDIKAENVFIAGPGIVKLGDFGFSTRVTSLAQQLSTFCGSPPYAAPELYKDESYQGPAVDIWALGVLLFFILTADMPFKEETITSLEKWGINRDSLEEGAPMGARSPAIATYRIMLHRLLTQANTPSKVSNNNSVETTTTSATSTTPTSSPCKEIVVRRPKLRLRNGLASSAPGGVKSKACNIV
ncbi:serine/threonine-protein kinase NIM1-like isoform X3 [Palaemon carinicauda]|uniref:serine/threonine-protein kinase NIM1-like isoform X3 n=1 Tax=Palaemon carinicauda TaxID=392227 RepID=UPI0035B66FE7